ncbi:MAG TPA: hypothetical protein VGP46_00995 [Acidimicrobiales bacterium]|nr:hypothetical protein [Acidimicrobiales bacterium]
MPVTVHLPEDLARRVAEEASQRHMSAEQLAIEAITAHFPAVGSEADGDALEAFIGSGHSGRGDLARRHKEIRAELSPTRPPATPESAS